VERERGNVVTARWIFQTAVRSEFPLALEVTRSDDPKLDALRCLTAQSSRRRPSTIRLRLANHGRPNGGRNLHERPSSSHSGLNKSRELPFAKELDELKLAWCRNPSRSGFGIPLLSLGQSKTFYPDFLVWKGKNVFALDTTGEHILEGKLGAQAARDRTTPKVEGPIAGPPGFQRQLG
jgi:type III restriction enzyme